MQVSRYQLSHDCCLQADGATVTTVAGMQMATTLLTMPMAKHAAQNTQDAQCSEAVLPDLLSIVLLCWVSYELMQVF